MNLTIVTTLLALAASSAIATTTETSTATVADYQLVDLDPVFEQVNMTDSAADALATRPIDDDSDAPPHIDTIADADARQLRSFGFGRRSGTSGGGTSGGSTPVNPPSSGRGIGAVDALEGTVAVISLGSAIAPFVPPPGSKAPCRQVACWVATTNENCATAAADKVQADVMRGRDNYGVESKGESGMWVRYWRTKFMPPNQGTVAEGSCGGDAKFVVTNCQAAGEVKC